MTDEEQEELHLAEAERHIARGEELIQFMRHRIERLQAAGAPTEAQEGLLSTMLESLALMKLHREFIVDRLASLRNSLKQFTSPPPTKN